MDIKELVKNNKRYMNFTVLEEPKPLIEFLDKDVDYISLYSAVPVKPEEKPFEVVGFCGIAAKKGEKIISLDGDTYNPRMKVLAYSWFSNKEKNIENGLKILVGRDW